MPSVLSRVMRATTLHETIAVREAVHGPKTDTPSARLGGSYRGRPVTATLAGAAEF